MVVPPQEVMLVTHSSTVVVMVTDPLSRHHGLHFPIKRIQILHRDKLRF